MSASGVGPFENDGALDLVDELRAVSPEGALDILTAAWGRVIAVSIDEYLEKDVAEAAVAAAALAIARLTGDGDLLDEQGVRGSVPAIPDEFAAVATAALRRVVCENSESRELWEEAGGGDAWCSEIDKLFAALGCWSVNRPVGPWPESADVVENAAGLDTPHHEATCS